MKTNQMTDMLISMAVEALDELRVIEYCLANQLEPYERWYSNYVEKQALEFKIEFIKKSLQKENEELGNPPIEDLTEFLWAKYREKQAS